MAKEAALEAGAMIKLAHESRSTDAPTVIVKGGVDLVTETDRACEDVILKRLRAAFPSHTFVGEETTFATGGGAGTVRYLTFLIVL